MSRIAIGARSTGQQAELPDLLGTEEATGYYVYCLALASEVVRLGAIGVGGHEVYTVTHRDLGAVVHDGTPQPGASDDVAALADAVLAHHRVVERAWHRWGAVLPLAFNTVIRGKQGTPQETLVAWLAAEHATLKGKLEALRGKAEYGVQVFWDVAAVTTRLVETDPDLRALEEEARSKPRGMAYLYHQKLERVLRRKLEAQAAERFKELHARICLHAQAIRVEKPSRGESAHPMLMDLSCLVPKEEWSALVEEARTIGATGGLSVRLVGPLPPYSFC